jgi:2-polyprenyl-6-methoxyphenol hydroxylase-like FAD-dependent oxidoreductase
MTQPSISIVGAGICGLTLGRCLLQRGVRATLYEKASQRPRNAYAITLQPSSYRPLINALNIDESAFKSRVAVDVGIGGTGNINTKAYGYRNLEPASFRANRSAFESLLREGLDVRWEHTLERIEQQASGGYLLKFANGEAATSDIVIDAEGPHSVIRQTFLPAIEPLVLPYVAYNGKRRVSRASFDTLYAKAFADSTVLEVRHDGGVLNVSVGSASAQDITLNWIFSRPARGTSDPLHKPNRSNSAAKDIPREFFAEVSAMTGLAQPFADIFDPEVLRNERILHWLMRSILVPKPELTSIAERGILLVGDSAHAEQIIGGGGANGAIEDAVDLAQWIAEKGTRDITSWYTRRYSSWQKGQDASHLCIAGIHGEPETVTSPAAALM